MKGKIVDFLGNQIKMGDTLVYPVRRGSNMVLKKAVVCDRPEDTSYVVLNGIKCLNSEGRRVTIGRPNRCVVVERMGCDDLRV